MSTKASLQSAKESILNLLGAGVLFPCVTCTSDILSLSWPGTFTLPSESHPPGSQSVSFQKCGRFRFISVSFLTCRVQLMESSFSEAVCGKLPVTLLLSRSPPVFLALCGHKDVTGSWSPNLMGGGV